MRLAFEFDTDVIVVPVERLAIAAERGHVGGGEPQPVAFDGDAMCSLHCVVWYVGAIVAAPDTCGLREPVPPVTIAFGRAPRRGLNVALIYVTSSGSGEGKTGVAAAIARQLAYSGTPVRLVRLGDSGNAAEDAAWFGSLDFAPGSAATPAERSPRRPPGRRSWSKGRPPACLKVPRW